MELLEFMNTIPMPVLLAVIIFLVCLSLYLFVKVVKMKEFEGIRKDVYKLFKCAEKKYSSGEGLQKMEWVVSQARLLLPLWLQIFLTDEAIKKVFQAWFRMVEDFLDDGEVNGSVSEKE